MALDTIADASSVTYTGVCLNGLKVHILKNSTVVKVLVAPSDVVDLLWISVGSGVVPFKTGDAGDIGKAVVSLVVACVDGSVWLHRAKFDVEKKLTNGSSSSGSSATSAAGDKQHEFLVHLADTSRKILHLPGVQKLALCRRSPHANTASSKSTSTSTSTKDKANTAPAVDLLTVSSTIEDSRLASVPALFRDAAPKSNHSEAFGFLKLPTTDDFVQSFAVYDPDSASPGDATSPRSPAILIQGCSDGHVMTSPLPPQFQTTTTTTTEAPATSSGQQHPISASSAPKGSKLVTVGSPSSVLSGDTSAMQLGDEQVCGVEVLSANKTIAVVGARGKLHLRFCGVDAAFTVVRACLCGKLFGRGRIVNPTTLPAFYFICFLSLTMLPGRCRMSHRTPWWCSAQSSKDLSCHFRPPVKCWDSSDYCRRFVVA